MKQIKILFHYLSFSPVYIKERNRDTNLCVCVQLLYTYIKHDREKVWRGVVGFAEINNVFIKTNGLHDPTLALRSMKHDYALARSGLSDVFVDMQIMEYVTTNVPITCTLEATTHLPAYMFASYYATFLLLNIFKI